VALRVSKHPDIKAELTYEEYQPHTQAAERETHRGDILGYVISGVEPGSQRQRLLHGRGR